jgi:NAD(P)-dependent dehydrogenase (short-subunit alcohol dehydrogenase family)
MDLRGKVAVVTGSSNGIGRVIAIALASKGAKVALTGRNLSGLLITESIIKKDGGAAKIFQADLSNESDINKLASNILEEWKSVDILANVAAVWHDDEKPFFGVPLHETPTEQINEVLDVNLRAPMLLTRLFIPGMVQKKQGKIINISGTVSEIGGAGWLHYYVSKLAVEHFTVGLAQELRPYEIQVNCISPSNTKTEALVKFFGEEAASALPPENVADLTVFLTCNPVADHLTGQIMIIKNKGAQ